MLDAEFFKIVWAGNQKKQQQKSMSGQLPMESKLESVEQYNSMKLSLADNKLAASSNNEQNKMSNQNLQIVPLSAKAQQKELEKQKDMKRVEIKGIEFDWIFTEKEGKSFLTELSETDNMNLFSHDIIKDII